jgi:hypothetical protein
MGVLLMQKGIADHEPAQSQSLIEQGNVGSHALEAVILNTKP